jgi:hypothetical protein
MAWGGRGVYDARAVGVVTLHFSGIGLGMLGNKVITLDRDVVFVV